MVRRRRGDVAEVLPRAGVQRVAGEHGVGPAGGGEEADFGDPIEWRAPNSKLYIALVEEGEGGAEVETPFEHFVYECKPVADAEIEEVELPGEEDAVVMDEGDEADYEPEPTE